MNLRRGFHRLQVLLAGLWLVVAFSLPVGRRLRLAQQLAHEMDGFSSPAFWLTFLSNMKMVAFAVGPIVAVYALAWALIAPAAWVVRGFSLAKTDNSSTQSTAG